MYILSLEIINQCNLSCSYCYLGEKKNIFMEQDTARKAVDLAVHEAQKQRDRTLVTYFIGGEPLMAFEMLCEMVQYVIIQCREHELTALFSTTINGTLLTEPIIDFFIDNQFDLKVSLDGPEKVHDLNRRDYAGNGSFSVISDKQRYLKKYEELTGKPVSFAHVITLNNYSYFSESFRFLLDYGCKRIETGIDHYCEWGENELAGLRSQVHDVFYLYKNFILKNQKQIYWNIFEQHLETYLFHCDFYSCNAGLNNVFVTTEGKIYTCIELPEFLIGDVNEGLNVHRIREIAHVPEPETGQCSNCHYKTNCKIRGCQASNYEVNKDVSVPVAVSCIVSKTVFQLIVENFTDSDINRMRAVNQRR